MLKCFEQHGGLRYINRLSASYYTELGDWADWTVGFQSFGAHQSDNTGPFMVGHDAIDWENKKAVEQAVRKTFIDICRVDLIEIEEIRGGPKFIKKVIEELGQVIRKVAALSLEAVKEVELQMDVMECYDDSEFYGSELDDSEFCCAEFCGPSCCDCTDCFWETVLAYR